MGIFDDAIRQHLDLKRRQGADESELKQLEDEAFGLPARPGEPDFPETGEAAVNGQAGQPSEAAPETTGGDQPQGQPEPETVVEKDAPVVEPRDEAAPHGDALLADPEAEPEQPPDDSPVEDEGAPGFTTSERETIADQPTEFFDHGPEPLELGDLDLDLQEELDEVGALEEEPLTGEELVEEAAPPADPPPADEVEVAEEPEPANEPEPVEAQEESSGPGAEQPGAESEDVLEETPEFLRDNPDDDELWFEQGKPKDFDF